MSAGRPNKYITDVKPRLDEIKKWIEAGLTEKDISKRLGINKSTLIKYKKKYSELNNLIKKGRKKPVEEIKVAMIKRAIGFQYEEIKTTKTKIEFPKVVSDILQTAGYNIRQFKEPLLIKTEITKKTALPDTTAGLILLKHWDKETEWTGDPATLKIKKEELEIKRKEAENNDW